MEVNGDNREINVGNVEVNGCNGGNREVNGVNGDINGQ